MKIKSLLLFFTFYFLLSTFVQAQHFSSPSYFIDWGNFNITSGRKSSTNYQLTDTVGQNAPGRFESNGYIVKSGAQYAYETQNQFSFSIDKLDLNFGTLVAGIAATDTNILTISTPSGHGYQITAQENHPLWSTPSNFIPNTNCDQHDCTLSHSTPWTGTDSYGFGFNATGIGASTYFPNSSYFRPFADISINQDPQIILSENQPVKDRLATINYRLIVSPSQGSGEYQNFITYTAVPLY